MSMYNTSALVKPMWSSPFMSRAFSSYFTLVLLLPARNSRFIVPGLASFTFMYTSR